MVDRRATAVGLTPGRRGPGGWALAAYHACDLVCWIATLNLLWIGFTLLGGGLLGAAPATVAAHTLARRRIRGRPSPRRGSSGASGGPSSSARTSCCCPRASSAGSSG